MDEFRRYRAYVIYSMVRLKYINITLYEVLCLLNNVSIKHIYDPVRQYVFNVRDMFDFVCRTKDDVLNYDYVVRLHNYSCKRGCCSNALRDYDITVKDDLVRVKKRVSSQEKINTTLRISLMWPRCDGKIISVIKCLLFEAMFTCNNRVTACMVANKIALNEGCKAFYIPTMMMSEFNEVCREVEDGDYSDRFEDMIRRCIRQ